MTVRELVEKLDLEVLVPKAGLNAEVTGGYVCDLLSWVMAKGTEGMAWITIQTHINVIAVASLHEFSCVIVAESCEVAQDVLDKAAEESIQVLRSPLSSYKLSGMLYELGVKN